MPSHAAAPSLFLLLYVFFFFSYIFPQICCDMFDILLWHKRSFSRVNADRSQTFAHQTTQRRLCLSPFFASITQLFFPMFSLIQKTSVGLVVGAFIAMCFVPEWRIIHFHKKKKKKTKQEWKHQTFDLRKDGEKSENKSKEKLPCCLEPWRDGLRPFFCCCRGFIYIAKM